MEGGGICTGIESFRCGGAVLGKDREEANILQAATKRYWYCDCEYRRYGLL